MRSFLAALACFSVHALAEYQCAESEMNFNNYNENLCELYSEGLSYTFIEN